MIPGTQLPQEIENLLRDARTSATAAISALSRIISSQNLSILAIDNAFTHMADACASLEEAQEKARKA